MIPLGLFSECVPRITYIKLKIQGLGLGICIIPSTIFLSLPDNLNALKFEHNRLQGLACIHLPSLIYRSWLNLNFEIRDARSLFGERLPVPQKWPVPTIRLWPADWSLRCQKQMAQETEGLKAKMTAHARLASSTSTEEGGLAGQPHLPISFN